MLNFLREGDIVCVQNKKIKSLRSSWPLIDQLFYVNKRIKSVEPFSDTDGYFVVTEDDYAYNHTYDEIYPEQANLWLFNRLKLEYALLNFSNDRKDLDRLIRRLDENPNLFKME